MIELTRDRYREMQYRLEIQRCRWQHLLRSLAEPLADLV